MRTSLLNRRNEMKISDDPVEALLSHQANAARLNRRQDNDPYYEALVSLGIKVAALTDRMNILETKQQEK